MKKYFYLFATAAVALASCSSDDTIAENSSVGNQQQKEIALFPVVQPSTRAAVPSTTFTPTTMQVAAYDATTAPGSQFFASTTFTKGTTYWEANPKKYWPLSPVYINFMAYSELNSSATPTLTWAASADIATWALVMDNNSSEQKDLMYAWGKGEVTQNADQSLSYTQAGPVSMTFKHAQAWMCFNVKAYNEATGGKITLNSITLNGAKYNGTYTLTFTNYNAKASQAIAGAWNTSSSTTANVDVPGWTAATIAYAAEGNGQAVGNGLMIVPDDDNTTADWTSFTINYTLDGKNYNYTYTPTTAAAANVNQATKYIFNIVFNLHEIVINPEVQTWADGGSTPVNIQ